MPRSKRVANYPSWMRGLAEAMRKYQTEDTIECSLPTRKAARYEQNNLWAFIAAMEHEAEVAMREGRMEMRNEWRDRADAMREYMISIKEQSDGTWKLILKNRSIVGNAPSMREQVDKYITNAPEATTSSALQPPQKTMYELGYGTKEGESRKNEDLYKPIQYPEDDNET